MFAQVRPDGIKTANLSFQTQPFHFQSLVIIPRGKILFIEGGILTILTLFVMLCQAKRMLG